MIWHDTIYVWYNMIWHRIVIWYDMIWYRIVWHRIIYDMIWYMTWYDIWYDTTWVRVVLGTSCPGYELSWVRVVLGTSCPGYELSWVRVVLGTSCLGYELSWVRVVQIPHTRKSYSNLWYILEETTPPMPDHPYNTNYVSRYVSNCMNDLKTLPASILANQQYHILQQWAIILVRSQESCIYNTHIPITNISEVVVYFK